MVKMYEFITKEYYTLTMFMNIFIHFILVISINNILAKKKTEIPQKKHISMMTKEVCIIWRASQTKLF